MIPPVRVLEYLSPMRYAYEFFIRNEFDGELGFNIAVVHYNFKLSIWKLIVIMCSYFIGMIILTMLILRFTKERVQN